VVGVLLAIILTRLLILLLGKAAGGEVLPEAVVALIAFGILTYMPVLLGIAVFVAVLLALTRSYRDSEMTVWFTSGLSIAAWVKPVLQFALPIAVVCALLSLVIAPWSQAQSVEYQRLLESRDEVSSVTPGIFRESRNSDRVFFVDKLSEGDDVVNSVFVQSTQNGVLGVMVAQKGYIETAENGDRFVVLLNGRRYEGTPGMLDYRTVDFGRYLLRIEPREAKRMAPSTKAMNTLDLLNEKLAARGHAPVGMAADPPASPATPDPGAISEPNGMLRDLYTRYFAALNGMNANPDASMPEDLDFSAIADRYFDSALATRFKKALASP